MRSAFEYLALATVSSVIAFGSPFATHHSLAIKKVDPVQWIWFDEGDPAQSAPAETRYFRKVFQIDRPVQKVVDEGTLDITADNAFTVWVNGHAVGKGDQWQKVYRFDVTKLLVHGKNIVAVEAKNTEGPAGLMVRLAYVPNGMSRLAMVTDGTWKASKTASEGWRNLEFKEEGWTPAKALGPIGKTGPWKGLVWEGGGGGDDRFTVPAGFKVEMAAKNPNPKDPFSLINMCFDARGRLLVSQENGPILLCTDPDKDGVFQSVRPYCTLVRNCQGMCWIKDALWLIGNGPHGTGLYRCRQSGEPGATATGGNGNNEVLDNVKLLHRFRGGMGEHGPHAIVHGPDDWIYICIGNHAWADIGPEAAKATNGSNPERLASNSPLLRWPTGHMGPDQGRTDTTEDVLLQRLNDSRGHAANILAPGGTIWRMDHEGKNMSLVAAGFRNHFDIAFNPFGELFTFDSDMEWDEALPWYRAVRICHCPPGADFVWRTGAANTPNYYFDSLSPLYETGRGSPVGVEFYDYNHHNQAFPEKYHGAYFLGDWSLGIIWAAQLQRDGATYKAKEVEKFCVGAPMNVTDLAVGPEGSLYFTMGGRGSQGGVYRIVYTGPGDGKERKPGSGRHPQPLSAWGRAKIAAAVDAPDAKDHLAKAQDSTKSARSRIKSLTILHNLGKTPQSAVLLSLVRDKDPEVRAFAIYLLGATGSSDAKDALTKALRDEDALVRRRACEALIRTGIEPPVEAVWPLLGDKDKLVRTAARLVVQRMDPKKWTNRLWQEPNQHIGLEGIIALCKTNHAIDFTAQIFDRLHQESPGEEPQDILDYLRTAQMALIHTTERPGSVRGIALECLDMFPHKDWRVNRELSILLTDFRHHKILDEPVHAKLLAAIGSSQGDRMQQIHYFYCLRLLHEGWTDDQKNLLVQWFESTRDWTGGHSFTPFLDNIFRDLLPIFTAEDRDRIISRADQVPKSATVVLTTSAEGRTLDPVSLAAIYERLLKGGNGRAPTELKQAILAAIGNSRSREAQSALRKIADADPTQLDAVVRALARFPSAENWPYIFRGLQSTSPLVVAQTIDALTKSRTTPKADDPAPFRSVILASGRLQEQDRWKAVVLLRHWNPRKFTPEDGNWKAELEAWSRWFGQTFPKEPPLPNVASITGESKWKFDDLLKFLEGEGKTGDVQHGRVVFEKANCLKCHKFGTEGEGLGPDLNTVKARFKRVDILESIIYPSKVISDQYRGSVIATKSGQTITGLAAPQGDTITVLQIDGTKVTLKKDEVDTIVASTISPMPEKLLDELTLKDIADLFAYLESEPKK